MSFQDKIRQEISERLARFLSDGLVPWQHPVFPTNAYTKRPYYGINPILLQMTARERGYKSKWWATYKQWANLGCSVRRSDDLAGEYGTHIVVWRSLKEKDFHILNTVTVFNGDQIFGARASNFKMSVATDPDYDRVESLITTTQANLRWGNYKKPIYKRPPEDAICLPYRSRFLSVRQMYGTILHELMHWSESRLDWSGPPALGELIAEIGAAHLESLMEIPHCDDKTNHEKYLSTWLECINNDPKYVFEAAEQAGKSVEYILGLENKNDQMGRNSGGLGSGGSAEDVTS
jgi:antirestriction protein ArdC